jgi:peptide/nickel transport system permease protein
VEKRQWGFILVLFVVLITSIGLFYTPFDPTQVRVVDRFQPPSRTHWFGTDNFGRDILSRILVGGRWSLFVGGAAVFLGSTLGVFFGSIAGLGGKGWDEAFMRIADGLYALPSILIALLLATIWGPGRNTVLISIAVGNIPVFMRLTRSHILKVKEEPYIEAARALGASEFRILFRHILPNIKDTLLVQVSVSLAGAILAEASLSYLGVGIQPPDPSWGRMLRDAQPFAHLAPWTVIAPGLLIAVTVLGFNLMGDELIERR